MITQTQRVDERIPQSYLAQHRACATGATDASCYHYGLPSWLGSTLKGKTCISANGARGWGNLICITPHPKSYPRALPAAQPSSGGIGTGGWPQVGLQPGGVGTGTGRGSGAGPVWAKQSLPSAVSPNLKPKLERKKNPRHSYNQNQRDPFPGAAALRCTPSPTPPSCGKLGGN